MTLTRPPAPPSVLSPGATPPLEQSNHPACGARADRRRRRPLPRGHAVPGGDERGRGAVPGRANAGNLAHARGGRGGRLDGGGVARPGRRRAVQVHPETLIARRCLLLRAELF